MAAKAPIPRGGGSSFRPLRVQPRQRNALKNQPLPSRRVDCLLSTLNFVALDSLLLNDGKHLSAPML